MASRSTGASGSPGVLPVPSLVLRPRGLSSCAPLVASSAAGERLKRSSLEQCRAYARGREEQASAQVKAGTRAGREEDGSPVGGRGGGEEVKGAGRE